MDERLLRLYEDELRHAREMGGEFAREFPKIAGRLGLEDLECADPYVERLLEGFAFLAARVRLKLEAEFPRFTQHLLETICPDALCPLPSMGIMEFVPDRSSAALVEGQLVPRGSRLSGPPTGESDVRCTYTTAHDVTLNAIEIQEIAYHARDLSTLDLGSLDGVRAGIRIRLRTMLDRPISALDLNRLVLHFAGADATPHRLYELVFAHGVGVAVHSVARPTPWVQRLPRSVIEQVGFEPEEAMLPVGRRSYDGHRLLREYYGLPERFLFAAIQGIGAGLTDREDKAIDVTILLDRDEAGLEHLIDRDSLKLHCTPAANLFDMRLDRVDVETSRFEYLLQPDRLHPQDFELHSIVSLEGFRDRETRPIPIEPFYAPQRPEDREHGRAFAVRRVPRAVGAAATRARRSRYTGTDVHVSLVDAEWLDEDNRLAQIGGDVRCTNRDLPLLMTPSAGPKFTCEAASGIEMIRCLGSVTAPRRPLPEGRTTWALIGHLVPNYTGVMSTEDGDPAASLRELLRLHADVDKPEIRRQIEGIFEVKSQPIVRRLAAAGGAAFGRGMELDVLMDEIAFEGSGIFVLGAVLERFFDRHAAINVFTETVIRSRERGEVMRWPHRRGTRPIL